MNDDEIIELVLNRMLNSDIFCKRMYNACINLLKKLDEEE